MSLHTHTSSEEALDILRDQGFHVPKMPKGRVPSLPSDITDLGDEDLMGLFTEYTAWQDYASVQLAAAQVDERAAQRALEAAEAAVMTAKWTGKSTERVAVAKAAMADDPTVRDAAAMLDRRYAYRKMVESLHGNMERDAFLVSRELTRRVGDSSGRAARRSRWTT